MYHGADHYTALIRKKANTSASNVQSTKHANASFTKSSRGASGYSSSFVSTSQHLPKGVQVINLPPGAEVVQVIDNVNYPLAYGTSASGTSGATILPASKLIPPLRGSELLNSQGGESLLNGTQSSKGGDVGTSSGRRKSLNFELREIAKVGDRRNVDDSNNDEAIVADIVQGCADDEQGFYFDEFGSNLDDTSAHKAPLECETPPLVMAPEELMSFEAFAGINRDGTFVASLEDSDVEAENDPPQAKAQMRENSQCDSNESADEEINKIPEQFKVTARPKAPKWMKKRVKRETCLAMEIDMVDAIPWDVDGDRHYQIFCGPNEWVDKSKDRRWYKMNSSRHKGFNGYRKTGWCQGLVLCMNIGCPKLQTEGVVNCTDFKMEYGCHVCKCCGFFAVQKYCGCYKAIEYDKVTKEVSVWYIGEHICTPKPDTQAMKNYFDTLPFKSSMRLTHSELRNDCMRFFLSTGQVDKAMEVARMLKDPHLIEKMRFLEPGGNISDYAEDIAVAFSCIGDIKKELDKYDKYFVWKYNCGKTNGGDTFVFKTSKHHLETALKMDPTKRPLNGKRSMLSFEKTYFDGMHKRVRGFKTFTLWVHHPGLRRMKRLASMDCKRETQDMVALFFEHFNSTLQDYTGDPNYQFNPIMLVTDEAGAIHNGLHDVFGFDFLECISTCQWHFKRCAWRQLIHVRDDDQATFRDTVNKICEATTALEYELLAATMDAICKRNKIVCWWNWWKVRRFHLVPALRGFGWTGTNWAEIGHSKMKKHTRIWLIAALWEDVINACSEHADWLNFVENKGVSIGKGPNALTRKLKERRQMRKFADGIIDTLRQGRIDADLEKHTDPDKYFIGSSASKHHVPRTFSKSNPMQKVTGVSEPKNTLSRKGKGRGKGSCQASGRGGHKPRTKNEYRQEIDQEEVRMSHAAFVEADEDKDDDVILLDLQAEEDIVPANTRSVPLSLPRKIQICDEPRRNPKRKRHGRNWHYEDPDEFSTDEEARPFDGRAPSSQQEVIKMAGNPPTYCFLRRPPEHLRPPIKMRGVKKYPKRCNGCLLPFPDELYEPPLNLVFRFKTIRQWYTDEGYLMTSKTPGNAYYHARDMSCLRRCPELERVTIERCYIEQACFAQLTEEHVKVLRQRHHWNPIRRNRAAVISSRV